MSVTSHQSLRSLFEININVNHISEKLETCDVNEDINQAKRIMEENEYDCIGIEENGRVIGYIDKTNLGTQEVCNAFLMPFLPSEIISDTTSLVKTLYLLKDSDRIFILVGNRIDKLVTPSDLQKAPIQLFLFGLVSLVEMHLLTLIENKLEDSSWQQYLTKGRLESARNLFKERKKRNEQMGLIDCLQLCDKREIVIRNSTIRNLLFESKGRGEKFLKSLERLRDNLAHAQIFTSNFSTVEIISLVEQTEELLGKCEEAFKGT